MVWWFVAACSGASKAPDDSVIAVDAAARISTGSDQVACLVVDAGNVYWSTGFAPSYVWKAPLATGAPTMLATDQVEDACVKAVDARNVYWVNGAQEVHGVPVAGGAVMTFGPDGLGSVATNGSAVAGNYLGNGAELWFTQLADGTTSQMNPGIYSLSYVALDATYVYFTGRLTTDGAGFANMVARARLDGGFNPTLDVLYTVPAGYTLVASQPTSAAPFAFDAQALYVVEVMMTGTGDPDVPGDVVRVPLAGGPAAMIASGEQGLLGIAVDDNGVYWAALDGNQPGNATIKRAPTPSGFASPIAAGTLGAFAVGPTKIAWAETGAIVIADK